MRCIVYAVVILKVAKKRHAIVDIVHDYQVASAIVAFYDVFTRTGGCHDNLNVAAGIRIFLFSQFELENVIAQACRVLN